MGVVGVGAWLWVFVWFGMGVRQPLWVFGHPQLNTILHLRTPTLPYSLKINLLVTFLFVS